MTSAATRRRIEGDRPAKPAPEPREMSDGDLLRRFAQLTHRMDAAGASHTQAHRDARAQRDLIEAEALRRMGGER